MDLDELKIKDHSRIKIYIKKENEEYYYYSYYYTELNNNSILLSKNWDTKYNLKIGKVGDIIVNFFNLNFFDILYDYSNSIINLDRQTSDDKFLELQNKVGILTSNLITKYYHTHSTFLIGWPNTYYEYATNLTDKLKLSKNIPDFNYLLELNKQKYVNIDSNIIIQFITDIRTILELGYMDLKEKKETNLLNLTMYPNTSLINYEILPNIENDEILEVFTIDDIITFLLFDIVQVSKYGIQINKCKNCGKYFFPTSKSTETLCNYPFSKSGKTCKELSSEIKMSKDELTRLYRNAYKAQHRRKTYYEENTPSPNIGISNKNFKKWCNYINTQKIKCENNEISIEDFKNIINKTSSFNYGVEFIPKS